MTKKGLRSAIEIAKTPCLVIFLFAFCFSCIERFDLDIAKTNQNYIIEAILLDDVRFQKVTLSKIDLEGEVLPVNNATIVLESASGSTHAFQPAENGEYLLLDYILLQTGEKYRLHVEVNDFEKFISDWEEVPENVTISDAYWEPAVFTYYNSNGVEINRNGFNFNVSTGPIPSDEVYIRYTYETTHINDAIYADPRCPMECRNCYIKTVPKDFLRLEASKDSKGKELKDEVVTFIELDKKFSFRVTMLVRQISISKNAYDFYKAIDQQRSLDGSIFDPPPAIIKGNFKVEGQSEAKAYGLFEVGRLDEGVIDIYAGSIERQFLKYADYCMIAARQNQLPDECRFCFAEPGAGPRPYYFE